MTPVSATACAGTFTIRSGLPMRQPAARGEVWMAVLPPGAPTSTQEVMVSISLGERARLLARWTVWAGLALQGGIDLRRTAARMALAQGRISS